jgi:hypothetical protein
MSETADKLLFVSLDDRRLPYSRAEIIMVPWGWEVEVHHVPPARRPLVHKVGVIRFATQDGYRYAGTVVVDLITERGFVLLSGIGHLRQIASDQAA